MNYDLVVIGGGPAGLMAALQAAEMGQRVLLLEKNKRLGLKLLITGGGRCNLTHNIPDYKELAARYDYAGRFLISAFSRFGVSQTIDFFQSRGVPLKVEADNKIFPQSDLAADVLAVFIKGIRAAGGEIRTEAEVNDFIVSGNKIQRLILSSGEEISATRFLMAVGGKSYPATGSSGDGYRWLQKLGHTITPLRPALAPILVADSNTRELEGLSLNDIQLTLNTDNKKISRERGPIMFTALGLSGPAALNISRYLNFNENREFELALDLKPDMVAQDLDKLLISSFSKSHKLLKNSLEEIFPARLATFILSVSNIDENLKANTVNKEQRKKILERVKDFKVKIVKSSGYDKAMVTVGGLSLSEINPKNMNSKLISNLYIAGEILDIAGPTGGFNLQVAWSTGYAAGNN